MNLAHQHSFGRERCRVHGLVGEVRAEGGPTPDPDAPNITEPRLKIASTEPLASLLVKPYNGPGFPPFPDATTDEGLAEWCRSHTETLYHPVRLCSK